VAESVNLVRVTVSGTPGTGTITLAAAVSGFINMTQAGAVDGRLYEYAIESTISSGVFTQREVARGRWSSSANTLTRDIVMASTNGGAKISAASDANVIILKDAEDDPLPNWMVAY